jgi:long-chain fatty acid transport protein
MKFAPNLAYKITDNLSVGANVQIDYAALDLGSGTSSGYNVGFQFGAIYKIGPVSLGLSYVTPQTVNHKRVSDFDGDGVKDSLKLQMPQTLGFGIAYSPFEKLLIEGDFKWINWSDAKGYEDFDWRDQYVLSLGAQYNLITKLYLRAGINYGRNPVRKHEGFNIASVTDVQGKNVPTFNYEFLRILGFPAIVETHLTFGVGYEFSEKFGVNLGYTHAFEKKISETDSSGQFTLSSKLKEDSFEVGLSWRF